MKTVLMYAKRVAGVALVVALMACSGMATQGQIGVGVGGGGIDGSLNPW